MKLRRLDESASTRRSPYLFDSARFVLYCGAAAGCGGQVKDGAERLRRSRERGKRLEVPAQKTEEFGYDVFRGSGKAFDFEQVEVVVKVCRANPKELDEQAGKGSSHPVKSKNACARAEGERDLLEQKRGRRRRRVDRDN